ncbi:hypothetical protein NC99_28250 [Sunxiuqinia dokdonensis]|uniref:Uncharacterized protein n=1 Tax=Sunxiuqinia dokdonensis TaxID=1409788 RepID=A0A0L8V7P8_9BACT|nr:hypothetical protein NC99_28250 [Sunxiuqinia dokdonensis]
MRFFASRNLPFYVKSDNSKSMNLFGFQYGFGSFLIDMLKNSFPKIPFGF